MKILAVEDDPIAGAVRTASLSELGNEMVLPICSYCKKVRDDRSYWQQIESYINQRTGSEFSHSICPDCYERHITPELQALGMETLPHRSCGKESL